jgi:V8-like Glu-specific endopeptidase
MNLDAAPFPWHLALARDLHRRLIDVFCESSEAKELVRGAQVPDWSKIDWGRDINAVWRDTLDRAAAEGGLRTLLNHIVAEAAMPASIQKFITDLLAGRSPSTESGGSSLGAHGGTPVAPATRQEAQLFHDDLTESVGDVPELLASIGRVMQVSRSVCKLHVVAAGGQEFVGTGTLLLGNRILTNHHVLHPDGLRAARVKAEFNYELDAKGQTLPSVLVPCDVGSISADGADDWGMVALAGSAPDSVMSFDLVANHEVAQQGDRAFILQHPDGKPKRLGFVRNRVSSVEERRIFYLTDTEGGSSGALVLNGAGKAIALHRAGGTPQKFLGRSPVRNNEGVRIELVVAAIAATVSDAEK